MLKAVFNRGCGAFPLLGPNPTFADFCWSIFDVYLLWSPILFMSWSAPLFGACLAGEESRPLTSGVGCSGKHWHDHFTEGPYVGLG